METPRHKESSPSLVEEESRSEAVRFSLSDGPVLVSVVRESISDFLNAKKIIVQKALLNDLRFETKLGCFVTLKQNDESKSLRGCVGFPEPIYRLRDALPRASIAAATEDPRFPPVSAKELDDVLAETSILTKPTLISVKSQKLLPREIRIGTDGLIMRWSLGSGLLLPQVATEYNWNAEDFLCNLSMKAGAPPDQWLVEGTQVFRFQAQVFSEESPKGKVSFSE